MPNEYIWNPDATGSRELVDGTELDLGVRTGTVIEDVRRRRPHYYDGLFLTAEILQREQAYFDARQRDLARIAGPGVVEGLRLRDDGASRIIIEAGLGITPRGEIVVLAEDRGVDLADVAEQAQVDATFTVRNEAVSPPTDRTGMFVVMLRPVEFAANFVATSYPTSLEEQRGQSYADTIEAVAVSLVPFSLDSAGTKKDLPRARAAYEVFVRQMALTVPANGVPLAVLGMQAGKVEWIDTHLVRRPAGAEGALGFGVHHRHVREAYLSQFDAHLTDVLDAYLGEGGAVGFSAERHFLSLPPVGRFPKEALEFDNLSVTQRFFPLTVDVDLRVVPYDELEILFQESLALPAIDLRASDEALDNVAVSIFVPVDRADLRRHRTELANLSLLPDRALRPWLRPARVRPVDALSRLRRFQQPLARIEDRAEALIERWRTLVDAADTIYFARRRAFRLDAHVEPIEIADGVPPVDAGDPGGPGPQPDPLDRIRDRLEAADDFERARVLFDGAASDAKKALVAFLERDAFEEKMLVNGALAELWREGLISNATTAGGATRPSIPFALVGSVRELSTASAREATARLVRAVETGRPKLTAADVVAVQKRYAREDIGKGIAALRQARTTLNNQEAVRKWIGETGLVPELDAVAIPLIDDGDRIKELATLVLAAAKAEDRDALESALRGASAAQGEAVIRERLATAGVLDLFEALLARADGESRLTVLKLLDANFRTPHGAAAFLGHVARVHAPDPKPEFKKLYGQLVAGGVEPNDDLAPFTVDGVEKVAKAWSNPQQLSRALERLEPTSTKGARLLGVAGVAVAVAESAARADTSRLTELRKMLDKVLEQAGDQPIEVVQKLGRETFRP